MGHRNTSGVIAHNERGDGAGRHECARAVHVPDHLGHRLAHVRLGVEDQLHQRHALNVFGLHVLDAGDVEEMIFVVVGEIAFHLRGIHPAVGLSNVNSGRAQLGENIDLHLPDGQDGSERNGDDGYQNGDRPSHGGQD